MSQIVNTVSRYMHDPSRGHWEVVRWILRYIKGTVNVALVFEKDIGDKQESTCYMNSDYVRNLDKHQSTTGCAFTLSQALVS